MHGKSNPGSDSNSGYGYGRCAGKKSGKALVALWLADLSIYPEGMDKLPAEYMQYLEDKDDRHVNTVMPVFRESMAEGKFGVHIRGAGDDSEQAFVDETVPFGTIKITSV